MVLESTIVCVDNSDFMRNGDFVPTRLQAQQDAVNLVCLSKTRSNPENNVGLLQMSSVEVLVTLTTDVGRILARLHQLQPKGVISFITAVRVAHLALKHRQGRNHKLKIVVFVGSPVDDDDKELVKVAKKLKKEKVSVDVINFGEETVNTDKLTSFINTVNGKDGSTSHLVTVPPGPMLSDALLSSPVIVGEDGGGAGMSAVGFEFGVDPNEDPELALALRVSMEEQRARQEKDARDTAQSVMEISTPVQEVGNVDDALLEQAMAQSVQLDDSSMEPTPIPDLSSMSEEDQIAYAMRLSMDPDSSPDEATPGPMEVDLQQEDKAKKADKKPEEMEDFLEVVNDPEFLQSVLESLPGVDPHSEAIQNAVSALTQKDSSKQVDKKKDSKDKDAK
ncbi:26S proteasome non-ATPase regulatory subunit 4-like [Gigantopelta aegis]|uniref:26S proteasome non-ATPase regulatory subunit 4-like n=1 Tax=Gigantopelta aegis TaxID=1735272 RepID=UPI001B88BDDD|nr:26S proteasome non-ATPase regulatory subunit 4-like [Gigantopelta aegis]